MYFFAALCISIILVWWIFKTFTHPVAIRWHLTTLMLSDVLLYDLNVYGVNVPFLTIVALYLCATARAISAYINEERYPT